ncbi:hypothetical protein ACQEU6_40105 [Spirillospora sp. CA-108201]
MAQLTGQMLIGFERAAEPGKEYAGSVTLGAGRSCTNLGLAFAVDGPGLDTFLDAAAARLLPVLERLAGRILWGGWPTGARVGHAMVHGGPYPATSDGRTTSVGSLAVERSQRPSAYQGVPR